eukprot:7416139-Pyramimonas_sp.AAC.1
MAAPQLLLVHFLFLVPNVVAPWDRMLRCEASVPARLHVQLSNITSQLRSSQLMSSSRPRLAASIGL